MLSMWLVDDNEMDLELCRIGVSRVAPSVKVRSTTDPEQVEAMLTCEAPDILLADYSLSSSPVTEFLARWRATATSTVFLVWSGREDEKTRSACLESGAHGFLVKPPSFVALCRLLESEVFPRVPLAQASL